MPVSLAMLLLLTGPFRGEAAEQHTFDIVIYGGTSAGVAAAVQAARMGLKPVVIEPGRHLGGLTSGGLGYTDTGNKGVIGGIAREFYQRLKKHYDAETNWKFENRDESPRYRADDDAIWTFEPRVAEQHFIQMLAEHDIPVFFDQRLDRTPGRGVKFDSGKRLISILTESKKEFSGKMFVDATYEGDLIAAAGVSYTVGREANAQYGETWNGIQKSRNLWAHRFIKPVDPYVDPGKPSSGLLHGIDPGPYPADDRGDHRVQAYCFRMCLTDVPKNRVPFPKPDDYDEAKYELLFRNFEAGDLRLPLKIDRMPNGKTDINNFGAVSTDYIGQNYAYPEAGYAEREKILTAHTTYQKGLMWTLANHPRVPEKIRTQVSKWGLAADEFTDNANWPHQIYVREARRMVSDYVMTELDCRRQRTTPSPIGMGSYNMDSHNCMRWVTPEGTVQNEGDIQVSPGGAYQISYQSIIPKRGEAANLLVPVCLSASHIAYGSIRMEPVFMILGQSAATAAAIAIQNNSAVQDVDYDTLRVRLLADKQVLEWHGSRPTKPAIDPAQLPGIVVDDTKAERINTWVESTSVGGYVGIWYLHDNNESKGSRRIRFTIPVQSSGIYDVRVSYTANPNRASNVPVLIETAGGLVLIRIDQRKTPPMDGTWISLGQYEFKAGDVPVIISNDRTDGFVVVDAVQFLPQN